MGIQLNGTSGTDVISAVDGSLTVEGLSISGDFNIANKIIHTGDTDTFMRFNTDEIVFETGATSKVFINSAGDLTLGATAGNLGKLYIKQGADTDTEGVALLNSGGSNSFKLFLGDTSGTVAHIGHGGQKQFNITQAGLVGVGTANPDQSLEVFKASGTNLVKVSTQANSTIGIELEKTGATTQSWRIADGQTVNGALEFYDVTDSRRVMGIDGSGRVIIGPGNHGGGSQLVIKGGGVNTYSTLGMFSNHTNPAADTLLSQIRFGSNTTAIGADIRVYADAAWGSNDYPTRMSFYTTDDGTNSRDERLTIKNNGQIRIPTNGQELTWGASQQFRMFWENSEDRMYLKGNGAYGLAFRVNGGNRLEINKTTGDVTMQGASGRNFTWDNSAAELILTDNGSGASARLKIGSSGDLQMYHDVSGPNHITCSTNQDLKVSVKELQLYDYSGVSHKMTVDSNGDVKLGTAGSYRSGERILIQKTAGYNDTVVAITQNSGTVTERRFLYFFNDQGNAAGSVRHTGATACQYHTSSDYRLKENVVDITDGISRIKQLKPRRFNFKTEPGETVDGFLAHEVSPVIPDAVSGEKDGEVMQSLGYERLTPLLTAALKEAIAKIETLETKVAALESS